MDRLLNYIFLIIIVYIFALWAPASTHGPIVLGIILSVLFCTLAFVFRLLTLDGTGAAIVIGIFTFGLGGWSTIIALLVFFLSSALISTKKTTLGPKDEIRRDGLQVWANGFWVICWLTAGMLTGNIICWIAALAAIATATADTWATEMGSLRFDVATYSPHTLKQISAGSQGGISIPGLVASLAGSSLIAIISLISFPFAIAYFGGILLAGVAGSLVDSYLGATLQGATQIVRLPAINWQKEVVIDNNIVNWIATGAGSFLIIILNLLIL